MLLVLSLWSWFWGLTNVVCWWCFSGWLPNEPLLLVGIFDLPDFGYHIYSIRCHRYYTLISKINAANSMTIQCWKTTFKLLFFYNRLWAPLHAETIRGVASNQVNAVFSKCFQDLSNYTHNMFGRPGLCFMGLLWWLLMLVGITLVQLWALMTLWKGMFRTGGGGDGETLWDCCHPATCDVYIYFCIVGHVLLGLYLFACRIFLYIW